MIKEYNESMGGVDLNDMLISLCRVDIQTRKRWYLKIITHLVNICNVNSWLLYRKYTEQLRLPKTNQHNLLLFMKGVADALLFAGEETVRTTPGKPNKRTSSPTCTSGKKPMVSKLAVDICYDGIHHWPEFGDKHNRCRVCSILSFVYCSKCQICLCLQKERNYFKQFRD